MYISEDDRFKKNSRNVFLDEEKAHKKFQAEEKHWNIKNRLQEIAERKYIREFIRDKNDKSNLIYRTNNMFIYENVNIIYININ